MDWGHGNDHTKWGLCQAMSSQVWSVSGHGRLGRCQAKLRLCQAELGLCQAMSGWFCVARLDLCQAMSGWV